MLFIVIRKIGRGGNFANRPTSRVKGPSNKNPKEPRIQEIKFQELQRHGSQRGQTSATDDAKRRGRHHQRRIHQR